MEAFLIGLSGALVGGVILAAVTLTIFAWEKKQANKRADKLMGELKSIYTEKLNQGLHKAEQAFSGKFN